MGTGAEFVLVAVERPTPDFDVFVDSASSRLWVRPDLVALRWDQLAPGSEPPDAPPSEPDDQDVRLTIAGTPVSGRDGVSVEALAERGDFDDLVGPFGVLRIHRDGSLDITTDPFGIQALYHCELGHVVVVGSRLDLVAAACRAATGAMLRPDPDAALSVAARGFTTGDETGLSGVRVVRFGHRIALAGEGKPREVSFWRAPWDVGPLDRRSLEATVEAALERQVDALRHVVASATLPVEVDLTGGKDSRLVLALCQRAGVLDQVTFVTRGGIHYPDVVLATHLATELGLDHTRSPWEGPRDSWDREFVARTRWNAGRAGVFADSQPRIGRNWRVAGFLGESWRTAYRDQRLDESFDAIVKRELGYLQRRCAYVKDSASERVAERVIDQLRDLSASAELENVTDAQYFLDRARTSLGSRVRMFDRVLLPLYSPQLASAALAGGLASRLDEDIRLVAMHGRTLGATEVPFTKMLGRDARLEDIAATPDQERDRRGEKVGYPPWIGSYRDYRARRKQTLATHGGPPVERWDAIRSLLLDDGPDHPVFDFVDDEALRRDLDAVPDVSRGQEGQICDVLGAKIQLSGGLA